MIFNIVSMADNDIQPRVSLSLNIPESDSVVEVHIINTTTDMVVPAKAFVQPVQKGHEHMNLPTFAFLVKNKQLGKTIMFDLGCRKDWWNLSPMAHASIKKGIPGLSISKSINDVLREGGEDDSKVDGVIWSHWHWYGPFRLLSCCSRASRDVSRYLCLQIRLQAHVLQPNA